MAKNIKPKGIKMIEDVLALGKKLGRTPTRKEYGNCEQTTSVAVVDSYFGCWYNFVRSAGLVLAEEDKYLLRSNLRQKVQTLADEFDRAPSEREFCERFGASYSIFIRKEWKRWPEFLKWAGLSPRYKAGVNPEDLFAQLQKLTMKLGKIPNTAEFNRSPDTSSLTVIRRHFGNYDDFIDIGVKELGLESYRQASEHQKQDEKERLIDQAWTLAGELGKTPTYNDFERDPRFNIGDILNCFGLFNVFLEAAGFNLNDHRSITKEEILAQIKMKADELGRAPTAQEFSKDPRTASSGQVARLFGKWSIGLTEAGLEANRQTHNRCIPNEKMFEQFWMLADELGRYPSYAEFASDERTVSVSTIYTRFHYWETFVEKAIESRN